MEPLLDVPLWLQVTYLTPFLALLTYSAWTDWTERKVYNAATYPAFFVGLAMNLLVSGWWGLGLALVTALIVLIIGTITLVFGWMGGGDVKLLAVIAAFSGPMGLMHVSFYSLLLGSIGGLIYALLSGYLWQLLVGMARWLITRVQNLIGIPVAKYELVQDERSKIPFAVAIWLGGIACLTEVFFGWPTLFYTVLYM